MTYTTGRPGGHYPDCLSLHVRLPSPRLSKQAGEGEGNLTCRERLLGEHPPTLYAHEGKPVSINLHFQVKRITI